MSYTPASTEFQLEVHSIGKTATKFDVCILSVDNPINLFTQTKELHAIAD